MGVLREPETGDFLMVRGAGDTKRLSPEEAAPFFAAAAGHSLQEGIRGIRLADHDDVILRFADADRGLAYPIRAGDELVGAIFFFFRAPRSGTPTADELPNLLLRHVIPQIETLYVLEQAPRARVMEERRRIARDLHDSFIQVLAALGLRLDALCASAPTTPAAIERERRELAQIREIIGREQRRVRAYIAEMREPLRGPKASGRSSSGRRRHSTRARRSPSTFRCAATSPTCLARWSGSWLPCSARPSPMSRSTRARPT